MHKFILKLDYPPLFFVIECHHYQVLCTLYFVLPQIPMNIFIKWISLLFIWIGMLDESPYFLIGNCKVDLLIFHLQYFESRSMDKDNTYSSMVNNQAKCLKKSQYHVVGCILWQRDVICNIKSIINTLFHLINPVGANNVHGRTIWN